MDVADAAQVHAVLVSRHGKLVLEEYFHGATRERLHTTRSAGKSVTSVLIGATLAHDARLRLTSPVYQVMNGGASPPAPAPDPGPRKRAMTLENLITMSSGYYCNDADDAAPGNEETMTNQDAEPDYYRYTLKVPMAYEPGRVAVYCSANPNLALGMVGRTLGEDPAYSFDARVAQPLRIDRYAWGLDPADHPYGGGSVLLRPRDFLKFGQLMLNGGTWGGHRILTRDYVERATSTHYRLGRYGYGYLWWTTQLPYRGGATPAFMALGNGGQRIIVVPRLDLAVAVMAGEYATLGGYGELETAIVPRYIMAAIRDPGDAPSRPFRPADYQSPEARAPIPPPELKPDD
jgi:CubicO group peptidase (beta-lactamase class C family)